MYAKKYLLLCVLSALLPRPASADTESPIRETSAGPGSFAPALGDHASVTFRLDRAGLVTVWIVDRDQVPVRRLLRRRMPPGVVSIPWDGRDDANVVVPDEAYALRISVDDRVVYDPSTAPPVFEEPPERSYSRTEATLAYRLARPSRVHLQAGEAAQDTVTGKRDGPVLKTIVDRAPRAAGLVVEPWSGFDESGALYVPDLPDFVVSIFAASLPENALITFGNRELTFLDYIRRRPTSPRPRVSSGGPPEAHRHHVGLTAREDRSPTLLLTSNLGDRGGTNVAFAPSLDVTASMDPRDAAVFTRPGSELVAFLDGKAVRTLEAPAHPATMRIPLDAVPPGDHRLSLNWISKAGPLAASTLRFRVDRAERTAASRGSRP